MGGGIFAFTLQRLRICWLQVLPARWLDTDCAADLIVAKLAITVGRDWSFAVLHGAGDGGCHGVVLSSRESGVWVVRGGVSKEILLGEG